MRAMILRRAERVAPGSALLEAADVATPKLGAGDLLMRVSVCAVCRTDLDVAEGRVIAPHYPVIPGHQVVGRVVAARGDVSGFREGDRVGIAWINWACGKCEWCRRGQENLCPFFRATGCDADGGYADYAVAPGAFAHAIPAGPSDAEVAPLLCAGAIGWRSLRLTNLTAGQPLGLVGFGASGHLVIQLARHRFPSSPVFVFARNPEERAFASQLGAAWAGDVSDLPPAPMGAIIDTTPAWKPIVETLAHLTPGGRLVINAIRKSRADQEQLTRLDYSRDLWMEREIKTVANVTREDVREMLAAAAEMGLAPTVEELPLERANDALARLATGAAVRGATVLRVSAEEPARSTAPSVGTRAASPPGR